MMEELSPSSGNTSSPRPQRGPEPSRRMSLAILASEPATTLSAPETSMSASCAAMPSNLQRSEEHTSELQSPCNLVCRLLLEKKKMMVIVATYKVYYNNCVMKRYTCSAPFVT